MARFSCTDRQSNIKHSVYHLLTYQLKSSVASPSSTSSSVFFSSSSFSSSSSPYSFSILLAFSFDWNLASIARVSCSREVPLRGCFFFNCLYFCRSALCRLIKSSASSGFSEAETITGKKMLYQNFLSEMSTQVQPL